jgi:mannitol/fructose-specific phosphotransferase system IIA component (Ntr-type)
MTSANPLQFQDLVRSDLILFDADFASRDEALTAMAELLVARGYCN